MTTTDELANGIAGRVISLLEASERSDAWLARRSGIPYRTLRNQLRGNPRTLTVANALKIAAALDVSIVDLTPEDARKAVA